MAPSIISGEVWEQLQRHVHAYIHAYIHIDIHIDIQHEWVIDSDENENDDRSSSNDSTGGRVDVFLVLAQVIAELGDVGKVGPPAQQPKHGPVTFPVTATATATTYIVNWVGG